MKCQSLTPANSANISSLCSTVDKSAVHSSWPYLFFSFTVVLLTQDVTVFQILFQSSLGGSGFVLVFGFV